MKSTVFQDNSLLVLMYHFVHEEKDPFFSKYVGLSASQFQNQIQHLLKTHRPITLNQLQKFCSSGEISGKWFYLTFDDGIKEHFTVVYPILKKMGLEAAFFPVTGPLSESTVPAIEKHRYCQYSAFPTYKEFIDVFYTVTKKMGEKVPAPDVKTLEQCKSYLSEYSYYSNEERYFRWLRDEALPKRSVENAINKIFFSFFQEDTKFIQQFYYGWEEVRSLYQAGMVIGGHTHSHQILSSLPPTEIQKEIRRCQMELEVQLQTPLKVFAYPNGKYSAPAENILKRSGIELCFSVGNKINLSPLNPFQIQRLDASQFYLP